MARKEETRPIEYPKDFRPFSVGVDSGRIYYNGELIHTDATVRLSGLQSIIASLAAAATVVSAVASIVSLKFAADSASHAAESAKYARLSYEEPKPTEADLLKYTRKLEILDERLSALEKRGPAANRDEPRETNQYSVLFDSGSDAIQAPSAPVLTQILEDVRRRRSVLVVITGHADSVGSQEFNMNLSLRRAINVRNELVRRGVKAESVVTTFAGSTAARQELLRQSDPESRRVEILIISR